MADRHNHDELEAVAGEIYRMEARHNSSGNTYESWLASHLLMTDSRRAALTWFNCEGPGHIGRDCPQPQTQDYTDFLARAKRAREAEKAARLGSDRKRGGMGSGTGQRLYRKRVGALRWLGYVN